MGGRLHRRSAVSGSRAFEFAVSHRAGESFWTFQNIVQYTTIPHGFVDFSQELLLKCDVVTFLCVAFCFGLHKVASGRYRR